MYKKTSKILGIAFKFCFPYILVNILITLLITAFSLFMNIINKDLTNELISSISVGQVSTYFIVLLIVYISLFFLQSQSGFISVLGNNFFRLNVDELFRKIFMYKSNKTKQTDFFDHEFMDRYSFVNGKIETISTFIGGLCRILFSNVASLVTSVVFFLIYEPWLAFFAFFHCAISVFIIKSINKKQYDLDRKQIKEQRFSEYYYGVLTGKQCAKEMRIYELKSFFYEKWVRFYEKLRSERLSLSLKSTKMTNNYSIIRFGFKIIAIVILMFGLSNRKYDVGTFVMLFSLVDTAMSQSTSLINTVMSGVLKNTKYICDYYDFVFPISKDEIRAIKDLNIPDDNLPYGKFSHMTLKDVSFKYPNSPTSAVDNVNLQINKGEIISILGYNGSGKTTLSKIINGSFSPINGTIEFNDIDINDSNRSDLFVYFGNAPQEFSKFSLPIHEYVGIGSISNIDNQEQLNRAYEKAGITDFISKFNEHENTILGKEYDKNGIDISGGEWQNLLIASAYMGDPEIIIMDEPTASIDPLKEMYYIEKIRENLKGKTAILISHRIGFARIADRIILMDNGKIVESGTHNELLMQNAYYAKLFNEQKQLYNQRMTE